jgi:molecular chaperone GrpE
MTEEQDRPVQDDGAPDGEAGQEPKSKAGEAPPSPADRLATLEAEKNDARERMLRIAAEFENYKKRARKEQSEGESKARESVLRDMLEVADLLERADALLAEGADPKKVSEGVQLVLRLFGGKLVRYDVKPFEAKGQPFDPRLHDAISQVPTADAPPGSVVSQVQRGYKIGDRLLRPATVMVAVAPPRDAANGSGQGETDSSNDKP